LIGTRGRLGIITSVSLLVQRVPPLLRTAGWVFPDAAAAMHALLWILRRHGGGPADLQVLSREHLLRLRPTGVALPPGEAALLLRSAGPSTMVEAEILGAAATCAAGQANELPAVICED